MANRARHMLAIHWGTFDLTDEPLDLPPQALAEAVAAHGESAERFRVLAIGERWHLPEDRTDSIVGMHDHPQASTVPPGSERPSREKVRTTGPDE